MKVKLHNKHPVYLKLQDAHALDKKLHKATDLVYRKSDGSAVRVCSLHQYLEVLLADYGRKDKYILDKYIIMPPDLLRWDCNVDYIIKAVEAFDEVELEGYDVNNVLLILGQYDRTLYVMDTEGL